ncbi:MAG: DUF3592 domain-containing protein [Verrucomicrobiota bacterium]
MEKSTQIKIVAVIALLAGPFFAYNGYQEKERLAKIEKEGVTVDGTIEGGASEPSGKRSRSYNFDVSFTPQGGPAITKSFPVTSSFFSSRTHESTITDPAVKVRYLTADVENSAIIVGGSKDTTVNLMVGIGAFAAGLITLLVMMFMRKS